MILAGTVPGFRRRGCCSHGVVYVDPGPTGRMPDGVVVREVF